MARVYVSTNKYPPLPLNDDEGLPIYYPVKVVDAKVEKAPAGPYNTDGKKQVVNVEFDVLTPGLTDRKIWTMYSFTISRPGAKRVSQLTKLIEAADPGFVPSEEGYETDELKGKVLRITLANNEKDGTTFQKADGHFKASSAKSAAVAAKKVAEPAIAGIADDAEIPF